MIDEERIRNAVTDINIRSDTGYSEEDIQKIIRTLREENDSESLDGMMRSYRRHIVKEMADERGRRDTDFDGTGTLYLEEDECVIPSCSDEGELREVSDFYDELEDGEHLKVSICQNHFNELKGTGR